MACRLPGKLPIPASAEITDVFHETPAIAVAADGAVWLAPDGRATRFDRGEWTLFGIAASWTGSVWTPFRFAATGKLYCACATPERGVFVGGDSTIYSLERRGPIAKLSIDSGTSANRQCWGAICAVGQVVATSLGAGPPR